MHSAWRLRGHLQVILALSMGVSIAVWVAPSVAAQPSKPQKKATEVPGVSEIRAESAAGRYSYAFEGGQDPVSRALVAAMRSERADEREKARVILQKSPGRAAALVMQELKRLKLQARQGGQPDLYPLYEIMEWLPPSKSFIDHLSGVIQRPRSSRQTDSASVGSGERDSRVDFERLSQFAALRLLHAMARKGSSLARAELFSGLRASDPHLRLRAVDLLYELGSNRAVTKADMAKVLPKDSHWMLNRR